MVSCRLYCQDVSPDAVSDPRTRGLDELIREVGITRRGLYLRMAEWLADHGQPLAKTEFTLDIGPITTEFIGVAAGGSCSDGLEVSQVKVEGKLAKFAQRWREQMLYSSIVDGEFNWMAHKSLCETIPLDRSWEAVGYDRIFTACRKLSGLHYVKYNLAPARHTLKMQAFLPGTGVVLKTDVKLVDLRCT